MTGSLVAAMKALPWRCRCGACRKVRRFLRPAKLADYGLVVSLPEAVSYGNHQRDPEKPLIRMVGGLT